MAAQRATAAEKTAPAGSMVMLGDVLGLGRAGSGSGLDLRPSGSGGGISFVLVTHAGDSFVLVTPYITGCRYG